MYIIEINPHIDTFNSFENIDSVTQINTTGDGSRATFCVIITYKD